MSSRGRYNIILHRHSIDFFFIDIDTSSRGRHNIRLARNNIEFIFVDIDMSLPPLSPALPLMGSSRTSGGIFHGRAHGNVPKHADITQTNLKFEGPVKGEVFLYLTDQYPRNVQFSFLKGDSDLVVIVNVMDSMAPILSNIAKKISIIESKFFFKCILKNLI
jgi:hypothetical protein